MSETQPTECFAIADLQRLGAAALAEAGASPAHAALVAARLVQADLDAIPSHGIARIQLYCAQLRHGRIAGRVVPEVTRLSPAAIRVDAHQGFAHPATLAATERLAEMAPRTGIACAAVVRAHFTGVLAHHIEPLAEAGLAAPMFANAPATIAAPGGRTMRFGTNPMAFACPREGAPPLVIDLSMGVVTLGRLMLAANRSEPIPEGWALDAEGRPTTDAAAGLAGSVLAMGGAKGAALAMMIDLLAGALTGSELSAESPWGFSHEPGPRWANGALILAFAPGLLAGADFASRVTGLCEGMRAEAGVRVPGDRRLAARDRHRAEGVAIPATLAAGLRALAAPALAGAA